MNSVEFSAPIKLVPESNAREHPMARMRRAKSQRAATQILLDAHIGSAGRARIALPTVVTITRIAPRKLDPGDNLNMSAKHVRDEIAAWIGVNDRDDSLVRYEYAQERRDAKYYGVRVRIEAVAK